MDPLPFPESVSAWVGLVVQVVGAVAIAVGVSVRYIRGPLDERLKNHGERIGSVEGDIRANGVRIDTLIRNHDRNEFEVMAMRERMGQFEAAIASLRELLQRYHEERLAEDRRISEGLARIDERMNLFGELRTALVALAKGREA